MFTDPLWLAVIGYGALVLVVAIVLVVGDLRRDR
jgi:hypothetical protein